MTVTLGLIGDNYSLIAADNRATYGIPYKGLNYEDNIDKLFLSKFGWVAGHGCSSRVKDLFEHYLNYYDVRTRHHIYVCYLTAASEAQKEYDRYDKIHHFREQGHKPTMCLSKFLYSLNYFKDGTWNMEVDTLDFMYKQRRVKGKNTLIINAPKETKRITLLSEKYRKMAEQSKDIHESIYLMACFIDEMAKLTKLISNNVFVGISLKKGNEMQYLKIKANAKDIKKFYKEKGDLSSLMTWECIDSVA